MEIPRDINIPAILHFLNIPHSFQIEKILRKLSLTPDKAYLLDGMNDISQTGFAVAMERRFHYDLDVRLGTNSPGYFFVEANFLTSIEVFSNSYDGIKIYFGLDTSNDDIRLIPILTQVKITRYEPQNKIIDMKNGSYYIPLDSTNGTWESIDEKQAQILAENFHSAGNKIREQLDLGGVSKYTTKGYYIGKDVLSNVLSNSENHDTTINKVGIKIYLGIQDDIEYYDYEKGKSIDLGGGFKTTSMGRDLHLIFVGVDDPNLGPLASFRKIFATIEADDYGIKEGILTKLNVDRIIGSAMPCVVVDPPYKSSNDE